MPSSSKRKTDPLKQATQARPEQSEHIDIAAPAPGISPGIDRVAARQNELGRVEDYTERAQKLNPVKLSPPSSYGFPFSRSPPNPSANALKSHPTEWTPHFSAFTPPSGNTYASRVPSLPNSPPQGYYSRMSGSPNNAYLSQSPPNTFPRLPVGHPNSLPGPDSRFAQSPPKRTVYDGNRRASMLSQYGTRPLSGHAPLPHEDQAHFYGAPQLDFAAAKGPADTAKLLPGDKKYFCGFDRLDGAADSASVGVDNVLLCGYEGGLEVYNVLHDGAQLIGVLEGLRGAVIGAKTLQRTGREDALGEQRPLIVVVLHGPVTKQAAEDTESLAVDGVEPIIDLSQSAQLGSQVTAYQTTVEVYSLARGRRVSTLYSSPALPIALPLDHPDFEPPSPSVEIVIDGSSRFIVVALGGRSGEIYVFAPSESTSPAATDPFSCIGKIWTATHSANGNQNLVSGQTGFGLEGDFANSRAVPIFSVSQRWLAVVPPPSSAQFSMYGTIPTATNTRSIPGLTISMSPAAPAVTCGVDTPDDRFMSRMSRMAAKNIAKGAQWAGDYGKQLWKQYVNPASPPLAETSAAPPQHQPDQVYFPPTHAANDAPKSDYDLNLIAIYDLNSLLSTVEKRSKTALTPAVVFEQPLGCSFLSFAPSGLHLLTVSKEGDTQILWDLKQMRHSRNASLTSRGNRLLGPHVREVTRITRVTDANVVDVIWNPPKDEQFGVLTDKGTLHVHRLEASLLQWPQRHRSARSQGQTQGQSSLSHRSSHTSPEPPSPSQRSRMSFPYDAVNGATSWLSSVRGRSLSTGNGLPQISSLSIAPSAGARGALAVATSASKAIGQGVHGIRHAADNKIYMHATKPVSTRCAMWMTGGGRGLICVVVNGTLKLFKVRMVTEKGRGKLERGTKLVVVKPISQIPLQGLPDHRVPPVVSDFLGSQPGTGAEPGGQLRPAQVKARGMWQPRSVAAPSGLHSDYGTRDRTMWKSFAELETTSDYAKFHTDPRVSLFVYTQGSHGTPLSASGEEIAASLPALASSAARPGYDESDAPWVFGGEIAVKKISTGAAAAASAGMIPGDGEAAGFIWRNAREGKGGGEGFFEDDADVIDFAE